MQGRASLPYHVRGVRLITVRCASFQPAMGHSIVRGLLRPGRQGSQPSFLRRSLEPEIIAQVEVPPAAIRHFRDVQHSSIRGRVH